MALRYDLRNISHNFEANPEPTNSIILYSMVVGISEITEKNWQEFYTRSTFSDHIYGAETPFIIEDIYEHVGLITNATKFSRVSFLANLYRGWKRDIPFKDMPKTKEDGKGLYRCCLKLKDLEKSEVA